MNQRDRKELQRWMYQDFESKLRVDGDILAAQVWGAPHGIPSPASARELNAAWPKLVDAMPMVATPPVFARIDGAAPPPIEKMMVRFDMPYGAPTAVAATALPTDSAERKDIPLFSGVLAYFPAALAYVARISKVGNDKHNPGEPMHCARGKSSDHADCIARHLLEHGTVDVASGYLHSGYMAWRALELLQEELEKFHGAPLARGAKL